MLIIEQIPVLTKFETTNSVARAKYSTLVCELPRRLLRVTGIASGTSGWRELKQDWPSATTTVIY